MSGCFISTGKMTNNGEMNLDIKDLLSIKINNLVIHAIPLAEGPLVSYTRLIGKYAQVIYHPAVSFTLSHIAIQLNMDNDDILIIEYGQYITEESEIKNGFGSCSKSSGNPRKDINENFYYYINKDGARITKIDKMKYHINSISDELTNEIVCKIIASEHYKIPYDKFEYNSFRKGIVNGFHKIECDIKNKITLKELIDNFKSEEWEAKKYNLLNHNCQTFGAEVIKILKAVRINNHDKIRTKEKMILPNCMIKVLWDNEELSTINTLGRIPIVGLAFDGLASIFVRKKK